MAGGAHPSLSRRTALGGLGGLLVGLAGCSSTIVDRETGGHGDGSGSDTDVDPRREPYELVPGEYTTLVIFRNDDPQPGYQEEALRDVEDVFIEANVPLTHGVIPAVPERNLEPDSDFCGAFRRRDRQYPGLFEYSLHGYTHQVETDFFGASEFGGRSRSAQRELLAEGGSLLAGCTGNRPATFIPPFNTYDTATVEALLEENITIVSGGSWFTEQYYGAEQVPFEADGALHVPNTHDFVADWNTLAFQSLEELKDGFDEAHAKGELYVPMLHYQYFTSRSRLEKLATLIDHIRSHPDVGFTTLEQFGRGYLNGDIERTEQGWRYGS